MHPAEWLQLDVKVVFMYVNVTLFILCYINSLGQVGQCLISLRWIDRKMLIAEIARFEVS
ncbi:MAG: hypothetical protein ACTSPN_08355 [Promethearchaeota archaeon]